MCVRLFFTFETELGVLVTDLLSPIWLFPWPGNSCLFPHSFVPLKSLATETYSSARASMVARLRSQNGLGLKWLLLCQESHASFSSPETPTLSCLHPDWLASCLFPRGCVHATEGMRAEPHCILALHVPSLNRKHGALMNLM